MATYHGNGQIATCERTEGVEEKAEVSEEEAVAAEAVEAQQQPEEHSTTDAAQAPVQQGESTRMQQQQGDITVQQEHAAEAHAAAARPGTGEQIAHFTQQIKVAASSAVQKIHSISAHASIWWKKRRRSSAENANRSAKATGNEIYQHVQEAASAAAAAARTEQPGARSTTGSAGAEKEEARTHNALPSEAEELFTAAPAKKLAASTEKEDTTSQRNVALVLHFCENYSKVLSS